MSDEENVREEYRPLTKREREILQLLLSVETDGIEELREQIPHVLGARWACGCASFNLVADKAKAPPSAITKSPLSEAASRERDDPDRYYELLLWVNEGWLSGVEIVDYVERHGEQSPQEVPPLDHWGSAAPRRGGAAADLIFGARQACTSHLRQRCGMTPDDQAR
jgi:hypothetical protein